MATRNTHRVDRDQWRKWNEKQRLLFNRVYEDITRVGSDLFVHPTTIQRHLSDEEFQTIAWNAAWTAANCLKGEITTEMCTLNEKGETIAVAHLG